MQEYSTYLMGISLLLMLFLLSFPLLAAEKEGSSDMSDSIRKFTNINLNLITVNEKEMASLRSLGDKYDWTLYYLREEKVVKIYGVDKIVRLKINKPEFNGEKLDTSPVIKEDKTYIGPRLIGLLLQDLHPEDNRQQEIKNNTQDEKQIGKKEREIPGLLTDISLVKQSYKSGEEIRATITAYNISEKELELKFNSGKSCDLYLLRDGKEVWRWSKGKFFTMVIKDKKLAPGEKVVYEIKDNLPVDLNPGSYLLQGEISTSIPLQLEKKEIVIKN